MSNSVKRRRHRILRELRTYYISRCIQGYDWARYFCFVGGRGAGKSTDIQRFLVKQWIEKGTPFTWVRLTDAEIQKIKADNCKNAFEAIVKKKYPQLEDLKLKADNLYCQGKLLCQFKSLSTFQNDKGTALYDCTKDNEWSYVLLDEMNKARGSRSSGDPVYQFKNMIETSLRNKKKKIKVFMIGNLEGLNSMMAGCFGFLPLQGKFGIYKLRKRKAVIHYFDDSESFKEESKDRTANLIGQEEESTFSNIILSDVSLIRKNARCVKPLYRIKFKDKSFVAWDCNNETVITQWGGESCPKVIPMEPFLDEKFDKKMVQRIRNMYDIRAFRFKTLIAQELFRLSLMTMNK